MTIESLRYDILERDEKTGGIREVHGRLANLMPAIAAFKVVCHDRPNSEITLQERGRVIKKRVPGQPVPE